VKRENENATTCNQGDTEQIQIKKWTTLEINEMILIWHHIDNQSPSWFPQEIPEIVSGKWQGRGMSTQEVHSHIQEIPENGADYSHFLHVHKRPLGLPIYHLVIPKWMASTDPKFSEILYDEQNWVKEFRESKKQYVQKPVTSTLAFNHNLRLELFGKSIRFSSMISFIAFQVGPGLVYIFWRIPFGNGAFIQSVTPTAEKEQHIVHRIYAESKIPYFVTALMLVEEVYQVWQDSKIWSNKVYFEKITKATKTDDTLIEWRKWYSQFYSKKEGVDVNDW